MNALGKLRDATGSGIRDHREVWELAIAATVALPDDLQLKSLQSRIVDLLQAIEIETILGGDCEIYRDQLTRLLDWIEQHSRP